ncbi:hypothetical protein [Aureimonas psammosilenae]|uniref:hypothetical protein n=1 Tax=Aureimonas psammosilenae TaxID=2495496 RepID=UPI0012604258|nr:hypothetical protein [Aureimonas psammosilenae]
MSRAKRETSSAGESAGVGHNSISPDQRHALMLMHRRRFKALDADKKRIASELQKLGKVVKADLGEHGLDQIKTHIAMETPEGREKTEARIAALREVASWAVGENGQFDMFTEKKPSGDSQAFMDGKIAGMDDEPCRSPYAENTADGEDWIKGWHKGAAVLKELLASRATAELIEGAGHDEGGDLDDGEGA